MKSPLQFWLASSQCLITHIVKIQALGLVWIVLTSVSRCWILSYLPARLKNCIFQSTLPHVDNYRFEKMCSFDPLSLVSSKSYLCCLGSNAQIQIWASSSSHVGGFVLQALPCLWLSSLNYILHCGKHKLASYPAGLSHTRDGCTGTDLVYRCASEGKGEISMLFIPEHVRQLPGSNYGDEFISQGDILQLFIRTYVLGLLFC